jgi:signal transduction histidine kinase/ActR/RegA family two-component response regulator
MGEDFRSMPSGRQEKIQDTQARSRQAALARLARIAAAAESVEPVLEAVCRIIVETLAVERSGVFEISPDAEKVMLRAGAGWPPSAIGVELAGGPRTRMALDLLASGPIVAPSGAGIAFGEELAASAPTSVVAALVQVRDRPYGVLSAYAGERRTFDREEVGFVEVAAGVLGSALGRHQAEAERLQLTNRLTLADRMASVGTMAAGVAHELNNPLAYISANLSFVADGVRTLAQAHPELNAARGPDGASLVTEIERAIHDGRQGAERMRLIIRDLLAMARSDDETRGAVDVVPVLESCIHLAANQIRHRATLARALDPVPPVHGNAARLTQVFLNLLVNAAQAIPDGSPGANEIRVATSRSPDGRVAIEVSDTGEGIRPEHLRRIFDPFFTTKAVGIGTGLGLSICHNIVASYGGDIQVESTVGRGSTFRVLLQLARQKVEAAPEDASPTTPESAAQRGSILVIDDEPLVGMSLKRALGKEHDVEVSTSALEALARIRAGRRYDLVLSDLLMPEMTGMDLHCVLTVEAPEVIPRMMFLTGGAFTSAARAFVTEHREFCLEKPFETSALRERVRERIVTLGPADPDPLDGES